MFKNMKIGVKILLVLLVMSLGTLLVISASSYVYITYLTDDFQKTNINLGLTASDDSKEALEKQAEQYIAKIAEKQKVASNQKLKDVRLTVQSAAIYVNSLYENPSNFEGRALPLPDETENEVACSKYMLAPGVENTDAIQNEVRLLSNCEYLFGPNLSNNKMLNNMYVGTTSGISYRYSSSNLYDETYDPRTRGWYQAAMEKPEDAVWMDTYEDSYGHTCITCAQTVQDANGQIVGVVASDIALQDMLNEITSAKIGSSGYAFVLDKNLQYIAHPNFFEAGFDKNASTGADDNKKRTLNMIQRQYSGIVKMEVDGIDSYVAFCTLEETGWKLCVSIDQAEVIKPAVDTKQEIDEMTDEMQSIIESTRKTIMIRFVIFFAVVGVIVNILSFIVAGNITRPIQKLAQKVELIGEGDFDVTVEVESGDEIGELASNFNLMVDKLKQYIENLTAVTAEKERIGAELSVATQIQADMLPSIFPAFPERHEFDIHATMTPAKEVGGDFYDFFLIDENHLALVMADVSGKGVPAALFMMISKTLMKSAAQTGLSPKGILEQVNNQLCENNEAEMFVTVWIGIMEISSGNMICANAGHEYPAIKRKDGRYELFKDRHGLVLAGMEGSRYREYELQFESGDSIFVYTDGVPEATNANNELYGTDRMISALNQEADIDCDKLLQIVHKDVDTFVGEAPQFDDITMLSLTYLGTEQEC